MDVVTAEIMPEVTQENLLFGRQPRTTRQRHHDRHRLEERLLTVGAARTNESGY